MAFWKKKSEDPWDMDPNRKRAPAAFYEREPEPQPMISAESEWEQPEVSAEPEEVPSCPWCGEKMVRAYLLGGRDMLCFADQRPHDFWGSLGHGKTYLGDDTGFLGGNYQSCWQCKPCYKLVIDIPKADQRDPKEGTIWGGNSVAPYVSEEPQE